MKSNSWSLATLLGTVVLAGALGTMPGIARAEHGGPGMMAPGAPMHPRAMRSMSEHLLAAAEDLNLTDEQRTKLKEIRRKAPSMLMPKRQAVMEARMDLHDLMEQDKANVADLRSAHDKLQKAQDALQDAAFELRIQAREVLTPEQRDKLHKEMRPGRGRGLHRMGDAGFAPMAPGEEGFAPFLPGDDGPDAGDAEVDEF